MTANVPRELVPHAPPVYYGEFLPTASANVVLWVACGNGCQGGYSAPPCFPDRRRHVLGRADAFACPWRDYGPSIGVPNDPPNGAPPARGCNCRG